MKARRLAIWTCLGSLLLVPGIAPAQRSAPAPPAQADVAIRVPLIIAGQPLAAGASIRLGDSQATRAANGLCAYPVAYDLVNVGGARTATPVTAKLQVDGAVATTQTGITLAAGQASRLTALVSLRPGAHVIELVLAEADTARAAQAGNRLRVTVAVEGPCGGAATGAPVLPKISGPPSSSSPESAGTWSTAPDPGSKALASLFTTLKGWDGIGWQGLFTAPNFLESKMITVDVKRKNLVWWFRWSTTMPGVKAAQWQVAHIPFGASVEHTDGLIQKPVPPPGQTADFTIDLAPLKTVKPTKLENPGPMEAPSPPIPNPLYGVVAGAPKYYYPSGAKPDPAPPSLYVRVQPLDGGGKPLGPASPAVQLVFKEIEQPKIAITNSPTVTFVGHVAGQPDAWLAWCYVVAPNDIYYYAWKGLSSDPPTKTLLASKGTTKNTCSGGGGWDPVGDFFTAVANVGGAGFELAKMISNFASATWEAAKGEILAAVGKILEGSVGCPGWCHTALSTALNAGMVALGVPPTIPNFDALVSEGEDYLAAQVAQELAKNSPVPIPPEALKEASKQAAAKFIAAAKSKSSGPGAPAWVPDPAKQYQPLVLKLQVYNNLNTGIGPVTITLKDVGGKHYKVKPVTIPLLGPKQSMLVPVTLDPVIGPHDWMKLFPYSGECSSPGISEQDKAKYQECMKKYQDMYATWVKLSENALKQWAQKYTTAPITLTMAVDGGTPNKLTAGPTIACQSALSGCFKK